MDDLGPTNVMEMPPSLSFEQKWEFLKPRIELLYIHQKHKLQQVIEILKAQYGFEATEAQYKYQINKKWRLRKNIPDSKKAAMNERYQHLSTRGMSAVMKYKGQKVDAQKLRRQAKMETRRNLMSVKKRKQGPAVLCSRAHWCHLPPSYSLMTWNMPYKTSRTFASQNFDRSSPFRQSGATPSDVSVGTPYANAIASPSNVPSPLPSALRREKSVERARMFLEGKYEQLTASMNSQEQVTMSTWLYQFWFFSFKTAKYWGQGPRDWVADILGFGRNGVEPFDTFPIPSPPHSPYDRAGRSLHGPASGATETNMASVVSVPSPLCRWAIHVQEERYDRVPDPPLLEHGAMDSGDPGTIPTDRLPAAIPQALQVAKRDPHDLAQESLGFAIMSRNSDMIHELMRVEPSPVIRSIDLFHLATSYLEGSKACCSIVNTLCQYFPLRRHYTNDLGHTVLDNLMIAIVKGHTSCAPVQVDSAFKGQKRFPGEEVDICGRWDADSDCIQELLAKGIHHIPFQWKHKFCHTSIQTICHSITTIWGAESAPDINTSSGLFVRRCSQSHCGLKMQMSPLHILILVTLQLSSHGCEGEDLFGAVAVLILLLRYGANPLLQSPVSLTALIGAETPGHFDREPDGCAHKALNPLQLADAIYNLKNMEWTEKVQLGWRTFCEVLRHSQQKCGLQEPQELPHPIEGGADEPDVCRLCYYDDDGDMDAEYCLRKDGRLGLLWSVIHTELVTYRRLQVGHPWMSDNIHLEGMLESLQNNCEPDLPLVKYNMMKPCCSRCGSLEYDDCIDPQSACAFYFSNMEDWSCTTFLHIPDREWWGFDDVSLPPELSEEDEEMKDV